MANIQARKHVQHHRNVHPISAPFDIQIPHSLRDPTDRIILQDKLNYLKNDKDAREIALGFLHDHEQFAQIWNSTAISPNTRRLMRKMVQIQTINAVCNRFYRLPDGTKMNLDRNRMRKAAENTKPYPNDYDYRVDQQQNISNTMSKILVIDGDCLDVAVLFKNIYPESKPAVLNMASARNPGGGWRNGAGAQEENLHRRTNLFECLEDSYYELTSQRDWDYPIPEFGGLYTPKACVFRGSESCGYPFFSDGAKYISIISCAAYSHPPTETNEKGELVLSGRRIVENTRRKLDAIFNIAIENKHDILILSAIGCGAFQNPPKHIAQLFCEAITQNKSHNPDGNIQPFADVFHVNVFSIEELREKILETKGKT